MAGGEIRKGKVDGFFTHASDADRGNRGVSVTARHHIKLIRDRVNDMKFVLKLGSLRKRLSQVDAKAGQFVTGEDKGFDLFGGNAEGWALILDSTCVRGRRLRNGRPRVWFRVRL